MMGGPITRGESETQTAAYGEVAGRVKTVTNQEDSHVVMESGAGVMQFQVKEPQGLPPPPEAGRKAWSDSPPGPQEGPAPADTLILNFWPPKL